MKRRARIPLTVILLLVGSLGSAYAVPDYVSESARNVSVPYFLDEKGDTIPSVNLQPFVIFGPNCFTSRQQERYYTRMVHYVRVCLPLARYAAQTMIETTEYIRTLPDQKSREKHLRQMERDLVRDYEPVLRRMTYAQGKVLLKLIARECGSTPYAILEGYIGTFSANFWQLVAKMFTADLKSDYYPEGKDWLIEHIATEIEQGRL